MLATLLLPGLPSNQQYALANKQMSGFGAMISMELKGGFAAVEKVAADLTSASR